MLKVLVGLVGVGLGAAGVSFDYTRQADMHGADYGFVSYLRDRADDAGQAFAELKTYYTAPELVMPVQSAPAAVVAPVAVAAVVAPVSPTVALPVAPLVVQAEVTKPTPAAVVATAAVAASQTLSVAPQKGLSRTQSEVAVSQVSADVVDLAIDEPQVMAGVTPDAAEEMGLEGLTEAPSEGFADDTAVLAELGVTADVAALRRDAAAQGAAGLVASNDTTSTRFADRACIMRAGVRTCGTN